MRKMGRLTPWLYLAAPLGLLAIFTYVPVVSMFSYSLTNWDGVSYDSEFVGIDNYVQLFTRPELFQVFFVSLYYLAASLFQIVVALYFAVLLSFKTRFRNFFKGILFFPYLINGVAVGFVFLYFFKQGGTLDSFLGLNFVLFLGAISAIPSELYEAAEIDGANRWQIFRSIIAPGIKPIVGLVTILSISGSLSVFEIPYIMTGGANGSTTFVIQTVKQAFQFDKTGLASAAAVVLLALILLITWIQRKIVPDERNELA